MSVVAGNRSRSRVRWLLVLCMFAISSIAYVDRVNISIVGQAVSDEFHLTNIQLGWVFSAFVLGYALFQMPAGLLADRLGPRFTLMFGVIWWGVFTALITILHSGAAALLILLVGIRFSLGAGEAVVYPASNCVVAAWIPSSERGLANGIIFSGVGFGAAITPLLITPIRLHFGWRMSFWVSAVLGVLAGVIWFLLARDSPGKHPWVSENEKAWIAAGTSLPSRGRSRQQWPWTLFLADRRLRAITLSYFCYGYSSYIFFTWFFIYLSSVRGLNLRDSSYYTTVPFLAIAAGSVSGGWISDGITRVYGNRAGRCGLAAGAMAVCALLISLGSQARSTHLASFILAAGVGALYVSQSSFWSVSADIGGSSAGLVSGIMNMGCQLGGALTASLTPVIANRFGWAASFLVAATLCTVGAASWLTVNPDSVPAKGSGQVAS